MIRAMIDSYLGDNLYSPDGSGQSIWLTVPPETPASCLVAVQNVDRRETGSYGIASTRAPKGRLARMTGIVEKPKPGEAPSTLGVVGRYILSPRIFDFLQEIIFFKEVFCNAKITSLTTDITQGSLGRFFHNIAKLTCKGKIPLPSHLG